MTSHSNPKKWCEDTIKCVRKDQLVEIWIPPVDDPEGELIGSLHSDYIPSLVSALLKFEQKEGR